MIQARSSRRALLIGVETCPAGDLWGAANDVEAVRTNVCAPYGLTPTVVSNDDATREGILGALDEMVDAAQYGDVLLLYFAGHGTRVPSGRDDESVREALCPHDFAHEDPGKAITNDELHRRFFELQRRGARLTALFDCCFSGGLPNGKVTRGVELHSHDVRSIATATVVARDPLRDPNSVTRRVLRIGQFEPLRADGSLVVLVACDVDAIAREHRFGKAFRGVFTHHLTEVLVRQGRGLTNGELRDAVEKSISDDPQLRGYQQTPFIFPAAAKPEIFLGPLAATTEERLARAEDDAKKARFRRPLKVHICWSRAETSVARDIALELHGFLNRPASDNPVLRPGVGIPTEVARDLGGLLDAVENATEWPVSVRFVILVLGRRGYRDAAFRAAVERLDGLGASGRGIVPLALVLDRRWTKTIAMRSLDVSDMIDRRTRAWQIGTEVGISIRRAMHCDGEARLPHVFISSARPDDQENTRLADRLQQHFRKSTSISASFASDGPTRERLLRAQIVEAANESVFLVVRTDSHGESPACTEGLLLAKRERIPILTIVATDHGEVRAPAYGGNHRTVHWRKGRKWEVVGRCVQVWLHHHHFLAFGRDVLALAGVPADSHLISRSPELLDLVPDVRGLLVYPDPPVGEAERIELRTHRPDVRVATPNTLYGRVLMDGDPAPPLGGATLAFSLSEDSELPELADAAVGKGLSRTHVRDVLGTIALATIHSGARIAYGGDFRRGGFGDLLSTLLDAHRQLGLTPDDEISGERALRPSLRLYQRDGKRDGTRLPIYDAVEVPLPPGAELPEYEHERDALWELGMRHEMTRTTEARVLLAGKLHPRTSANPEGYLRAWPGLLEEAYRTLDADAALYVVGGLGGCAGAIASMLRTLAVPPAFDSSTALGDSEYPARVERLLHARRSLATHPDAAKQLLIGANGPLGMRELAESVLARWRAFVDEDAMAWQNGLTVAQNLRLFASTDPTEISHLVFGGIAKLRETHTASPRRLRCYLGDIASVPEVDAYAVTVTPGLAQVGASASLDARCGGRLRAAVAKAGVEWVTIGSSTLAGRHALIATLDRGPSDAIADIERRIRDAAETIGRECKRLGITSLACPPFGTTLGVPVELSVAEMLAGFAAASAPAIVTFCEADEERYGRLRVALPKDGFEALREGRLPPAALRETGLYLSATSPDTDTPGRISAMLYSPSFGTSIPSGVGPAIDLVTWSSLRLRCDSMHAVKARGEALLQLIEPGVREQLVDATDERLSIIVDTEASGLPWETLAAAMPSATAISRPFTRRIALRGANARRVDVRGNGRRRVLLVANPTENLEGADDEADELEQMLSARLASVDVRVLVRRDATVDRVKRELADGPWDVLHYAGHAFFDANSLDHSGLMLAGGVLRAAEVRTALGNASDGALAPSLIVLGACESARVRGRDLNEVDETMARMARWSLAEALLRQGVRALIGTFFAVTDRGSLEFARALYDRLLMGRPIADAVAQARKALFDKERHDWANFILYGDGDFTL